MTNEDNPSVRFVRSSVEGGGFGDLGREHRRSWLVPKLAGAIVCSLDGAAWIGVRTGANAGRRADGGSASAGACQLHPLVPRTKGNCSRKAGRGRLIRNWRGARRKPPGSEPSWYASGTRRIDQNCRGSRQEMEARRSRAELSPDRFKFWADGWELSRRDWLNVPHLS